MGASRCTGLAFGIALAAIGAAGHFDGVRAETPDAYTPPATKAPATRAHGEQTPPVNPGAQTELNATVTPGSLFSPDCVNRTDLLGVSRVVEIDTTAGPRFGDQYSKDEVKFLQPGEVVLTFDDGPMRRYTLPILDALDEQCVRATFFSVGRMAISDPATLQEVARRGHTIGVHTWSHKKLSALGADAMKREFELGASAVAGALGTPIAPFFRFPYLAHSKSALAYIQGRGMGIFGIHVDSADFRTKSPGVVLRNVMSQLDREKKGILLFHDIQPSTAGALASLLAELKTRGYKVVHMVPKHGATTLPEYDAIAEKALRAKSAAAANSPIAKRSVTWPVSGDEPAPEQGKPAAKAAPSAKSGAPKTATRPAKPYDWANPSNDPWQLTPFGSQ
ncbi:polysaccharide deacetylase family protein [Hyphomicrobium sp. LHD-15]|uniref:polysaccharide deacetylase family protein n=1 Tax=Hyphomicrobium sp. LHD-15 TaxID=3072142 RepID=UPI00280D6083|nr:polysaccharide deacetylase family protein [Hyphomicrobium sp. LHD-15]MDQ8700488.1 polysaccharide deacetylase family protein [Hyphomicrobium sp. LHD-15]